MGEHIMRKNRRAHVAQPQEHGIRNAEGVGSTPAVGSTLTEEERRRIANEMFLNILKSRNEILAAFIAQYGLHPDECQQVTMEDPATGNTVWFVRERKPALAGGTA